MITKRFFRAAVQLVLFLTILAALTQCTDEEAMYKPILKFPDENPELDSIPPDSVSGDTIPGDTIPDMAPPTMVYTVPENVRTIDGEALEIKPGAHIVLDASIQYGTLRFVNIVGTEAEPIIIRNEGGVAVIDGSGQAYAMKFQSSKHFRITGGDASDVYGIVVKNAHLGISLEYLSTNFEVDHVELFDIGFAGVMAKTDPSCDDATIQGNFTMEDILIHDNYVHDTGGEGFYIGNSKYQHGHETACGVRFPHEIHNVKVYNNIVKNSGWEGIQVGSATQGAEVFNNRVENYGLADKPGQNNGIQIGSGTGGLFYNNIIINGRGNGLIMMGLGDNIVYNNIIVGAGENGIFCDERRSPGPGYQFVNNTIINPAGDGIRLYSEEVPVNVLINNVIINPGTSYADENRAFIYTQSASVNVQESNNYFSRDLAAVRFVNAAGNDFRIEAGSPLIDAGADIESYGIDTDFYGQSRRKGATYDIGAAEF